MKAIFLNINDIQPVGYKQDKIRVDFLVLYRFPDGHLSIYNIFDEFSFTDLTKDFPDKIYECLKKDCEARGFTLDKENLLHSWNKKEIIP